MIILKVLEDFPEASEETTAELQEKENSEKSISTEETKSA